MTSTSTSHGRRAACAVVVALALAACGNQVAGSGGSGSLPLLRIGTGQYGAADAVAPRSGGSGAATDDPYPLRGTLPSGPSTAPVYRFATTGVTASDVAALAVALGVTASPVRHPHGWDVATTSGDVRVHDGGTSWSYSRVASDCPSYVVDIDNADGATSANGCAVAVPPATTNAPTATPAAAPDGATALAAAGPVLRATGLDPTQARVMPASTGYPVRTVVVDPAVAGLATSGVRTTVDVDAQGVLGATGVLAAPSAGDAYPIVSAAAALDLLRAMPRPEIAISCVQGAVCPGVGPRPVTGATLGLAQAYDAGTEILVPAWLFTVTGSDDPVAVVAVERRYLGDPNPDPIGSAPGATSAPNPGTSGGGSGSVPGSSGGPATPVPVTEPPSPILSVQSVALGKDGSTLLLGGVGGVCDDYSGAATETSGAVTVSIVATPQSPGQVCAAMAREFTVTVTLASPWSGRSIVDAATGKALHVG